jgi:hypothetical protein
MPMFERLKYADIKRLKKMGGIEWKEKRDNIILPYIY